MSVPYADLNKLRELGVIHEVNRQFFHPLGLALELVLDSEDESIRVGGIWDMGGLTREGFANPSGIIFDPRSLDPEKATAFEQVRKEKHEVREEMLGYVVQPLDAGPPIQS